MTPDAIALARQALEDDTRATKGPWEIWTSNSFRRITQRNGRDGGVLSAVKCRDGMPDLDGQNRDRDLDWIAAARTREPLLATALLEAHRELEEMRVLVARWEALGERHDLALREPGCVCTYEQGDSDCKVHPTCSQCGAVDCECAK